MADTPLPPPNLDSCPRSHMNAARQPLNVADRTLLHIDRSMRLLGSCGFETQTFVWLDRPIDATTLRSALACLGEHFPVVTARLVEQAANGPYWKFRLNASCPLAETTLTSNSPQAVLDQAGRRLSAASDPTETDPIQFELLHRPEGGDVFLIQYNHALIDHAGIVRLVQYLDRSGQGTLGNARREDLERDLVRAYLRGIPRRRRRSAARTALDYVKKLRGGAIRLGQTVRSRAGPLSLRILSRRLSGQQTDTLQANILDRCGVPSLSMAVLASAFRAFARYAPKESGRYYLTGLGVDLGIHRSLEPAWHNYTSLIPMRIEPHEISPRDSLTRLLNSRMRQLLATEIDLGVLALSALHTRRPEHARWATDLLMGRCISFWYGYFGNLGEPGQPFCGTKIQEIYSAGPSWSPCGLTLLVNQFGKELLFQATYMPDLVPELIADRFLDAVLADLASFTSG